MLIQWLEQADAFNPLTLMFQREVAQRITAQPGDSNFGRLSILTGWIADSAILFDIPPDAFVRTKSDVLGRAYPPAATPTLSL